ncbi:MAG TPA: alkaline phosphatase D family protein, partial [Gemmatimonadaceae bacterium]|nr:alkaline phosphatase D family protein [Gemmatimonadaceae bacterium]
PADGAITPLRFGVASCANYEQGLFTAYGHLAAERCDLVTHLGDYIYEYGGRDQGVVDGGAIGHGPVGRDGPRRGGPDDHGGIGEAGLRGS